MKTRSIQQIIEHQAQKWHILGHEKKKEIVPFQSMIYISRQPGSCGFEVAQNVADALHYDLFDRALIMKIAESARMSTYMVETLDEKGRNVVLDWMSQYSNENHIWFDEYLEHLMKVIGTIARHGRAVVVGRGAGYILPRTSCLRVRVIEPEENRIARYMREKKITEAKAKKELANIENEQHSFIKRYFDREIADPLNYHLVVNTALMSVEEAGGAIIEAYNRSLRRIN